jgi:hypothetical protein
VVLRAVGFRLVRKMRDMRHRENRRAIPHSADSVRNDGFFCGFLRHQEKSDQGMRVRAYEETDLEELKRIHAVQGFSYGFPDLGNPLFLTKLVLVGEDSGREEAAGEDSCRDEAQSNIDDGCAPTKNKIAGAALLRLTAEAYLLLDPKAGTPRERWEWLLGLHAVTEREAERRGLEDVHAWLPPEIAGKFGKRLRRLGWVRDDEWTPYCKRFG